MCIWNVKEKNRHCEYCSYAKCDRKAPAAKEVSERYISIMKRIVGNNLLSKRRNAELVWARRFICYQMRLDGFSAPVIGKQVGMSHSSVLLAHEKVTEMLRIPSMYEKEMDIWRKFLSLQKT